MEIKKVDRRYSLYEYSKLMVIPNSVVEADRIHGILSEAYGPGWYVAHNRKFDTHRGFIENPLWYIKFHTKKVDNFKLNKKCFYLRDNAQLTYLLLTMESEEA